MPYFIAVKPTYNIAFMERFLTMCQTELEAVLRSHHQNPKAMAMVPMGKGTMLRFELEEALSDGALNAIYRLSFFYMLFRSTEGGAMKPVPMATVQNFGDDLSIRMKYNGKTNETITRMMMNLALSASDFAHEAHPKLLDPLCGRGTTLFEGMISGYDVYGVDRDRKSIAEMGTYITRYVKEARFKHTNKRGKVISGGQHIGDLFELHYAKEKADYKAGRLREMKVMSGDTTNFVGAFRQNSIHTIVTDMPYNVQHSGKGKATGDGLSWLLDEGLASWTPFLKKGGTVALSWNLYTDKREAFEAIFEKHGYTIITEAGYDALAHRVAQAITRDIIVAKKS